MELGFWLLSSDTHRPSCLPYLFHPRHPPTTCISLEGRAFLVVVTFVVGPAGGLLLPRQVGTYLFCHSRHTVGGSLRGWRIRSRDGHKYVNKKSPRWKGVGSQASTEREREDSQPGEPQPLPRPSATSRAPVAGH